MRPLAQRAERLGRTRLPLRHRRAHGQSVLSEKGKSDARNDAAIGSQMNRRGSRGEDRVISGKTLLNPRSSFLRSLRKRQPPSKNITRHSEIWTECEWLD